MSKLFFFLFTNFNKELNISPNVFLHLETYLACFLTCMAYTVEGLGKQKHKHSGRAGFTS